MTAAASGPDLPEVGEGLDPVGAGGVLARDDRPAYAGLDAFVYGFTLQDAVPPFDRDAPVAEFAEPMLARMPADATRTSPSSPSSTSCSRPTTSAPGSRSAST